METTFHASFTLSAWFKKFKGCSFFTGSVLNHGSFLKCSSHLLLWCFQLHYKNMVKDSTFKGFFNSKKCLLKGVNVLLLIRHLSWSSSNERDVIHLSRIVSEDDSCFLPWLFRSIISDATSHSFCKEIFFRSWTPVWCLLVQEAFILLYLLLALLPHDSSSSHFLLLLFPSLCVTNTTTTTNIFSHSTSSMDSWAAKCHRCQRKRSHDSLSSRRISWPCDWVEKINDAVFESAIITIVIIILFFFNSGVISIVFFFFGNIIFNLTFEFLDSTLISVFIQVYCIWWQVL